VEGSERTTRDQVDWILDLFRRAKRYWMLGGAVFVLGAALSLTLALGQKPTYESEVVLLYQEMISQSVLQGRDVAKSSRSLSSRYNDMVYSRSQLAKVVEKFGLLPDVVEDEGMVAATEEIRQRVNFRDNGTGTFRIIYRGDTREEAKEVVEEIADLLIEEDNRIRRKQAKTTKEFLVTEREEAETELRARELELAEFLAAHPEFAAETVNAAAGAAVRVRQGDKKTPIATPRTGDAQLAALLRQRTRTKALLDNPNKPPPVILRTGEKTPERIAGEKAVDSAKRNLEKANGRLAAAKAKYTDLHPDVRAAQAAVGVAERNVAAKEAALPALVAPSAVPVKPIDRAGLTKQLAELDRAISARRRRGTSTTPVATPKATTVGLDLVETETLWNKLMRDVAQSRERTELLESRVFTANITASSEFADASQLTVIDDAFLPPKPAGRSRKLVALAGTFLFGLLGVGVSLGLALIDDRIFRRGELESASGVAMLTYVPGPERSWRQRLKARAESAQKGKGPRDG